MTTSDQENKDNVLPLRTNSKGVEIPHEIAHPASKWFAEGSEDPLSDILFEFDELEAKVKQVPDVKDFIYAHIETKDTIISARDSLPKMMAKISGQIKRLKEDTKRIKYYMDEVEDHLID